MPLTIKEIKKKSVETNVDWMAKKIPFNYFNFDFCFLQMFKSVAQLLTTVTLTPTAPTAKDHSPALVIRGTLEMGSRAMVLTYSFNLKFLVRSYDLYRKWYKDILLDFFWNKELNYSNI